MMLFAPFIYQFAPRLPPRPFTFHRISTLKSKSVDYADDTQPSCDTRDDEVLLIRDWCKVYLQGIKVGNSLSTLWGRGPTLPYSDKRKQLSNMTFLINEQNVSVMYCIYQSHTAISLCLDLNILQQDAACFCSKFGLEVEHAKSNLKTSLSP